jgi:hypothetical protein
LHIHIQLTGKRLTLRLGPGLGLVVTEQLAPLLFSRARAAGR